MSVTIVLTICYIQIRTAELRLWFYVSPKRSTGFVMPSFPTYSRTTVSLEKIFGLIQSFLTNRVTKVVLNKHTSSSFHLPGTWMFINDLPDVFSSQLRIYEEYFCHIWPAASTTYLESLD